MAKYDRQKDKIPKDHDLSEIMQSIFRAAFFRPNMDDFKLNLGSRYNEMIIAFANTVFALRDRAQNKA